MTKEPLNKIGGRIVVYVKMNQTVAAMAQMCIAEIAIERKKRWPIQLMEYRDYFMITHSLTARIVSDLSDVNASPVQKGALAFRNVFIENIHAGRGSWVYSIA
ncbi:MAG TPA: hypothetical protein VFE47_17110 [Tepidisphaeraceae bacterium]|nr:hypothetical protein [Tepidisphaeraceae bacterium]